MSENAQTQKESTAGQVFSWIFGVLWLLSGLFSLILTPVAAIFSLLAGIVVLPPLNRLLRKSMPFLKGWVAAFIGIGLVFIGSILGIGSAINGVDEILEEVDDTASANTPLVEEDITGEGRVASAISENPESLETNVTESTEPVESENEESTEELPNQTTAQRNAVRQAESYLDFSAFSEEGLIRQLEFEGFSNEDAIYAVSNVEVDWNEQAAQKAESYLDFSGFSRSGIIEQLEFEGFTTEQAIYGADSVGL